MLIFILQSKNLVKILIRIKISKKLLKKLIQRKNSITYSSKKNRLLTEV